MISPAAEAESARVAEAETAFGTAACVTEAETTFGISTLALGISAIALGTAPTIAAPAISAGIPA